MSGRIGRTRETEVGASGPEHTTNAPLYVTMRSLVGGGKVGGENQDSLGNSALNKVNQVSLIFNIQVLLQISKRQKYIMELFPDFFELEPSLGISNMSKSINALHNQVWRISFGGIREVPAVQGH